MYMYTHVDMDEVNIDNFDHYGNFLFAVNLKVWGGREEGLRLMAVVPVIKTGSNWC